MDFKTSLLPLLIGHIEVELKCFHSEPNDEKTRTICKDTVNSFLSDTVYTYQERFDLFGYSWFVICDNSNNTEEDVNNGILNCKVIFTYPEEDHTWTTEIRFTIAPTEIVVTRI
jgi:hypothetical protein